MRCERKSRAGRPAARALILWTTCCAVLFSSCARQEKTGDPMAWVRSAWDDYRLGEFDLAAAGFQAAVQAIPETDERHLQALYGLACTWNLRRPGEDLQLAEKLYRRIIELAPQHDLAAWSTLALARMKHLVPVGQEPDFREVRKAYQSVVDRFPEHLAGKEAFIYLNATLVSSLDEDETRLALSNLYEFIRNPSNVFLGPAYSLIAVGSTTLGEHDKRLWAEIRSLEETEIDPTNPFTEFAWQYWNIATIAEFEVGDFDTARAYYGKLIEEYPTDIRVYAALRALERMDRIEQEMGAKL